EVAPDTVLLDLGFDWIGLTTDANAINDKDQLDITPVLFFDYPSVGEIAKYLAAERESDIRRFYQSSAPAAEAVAPPPASQRPAQTVQVESRQEAAFEIRKGWNPAAPEREATPSASGAG